MKEANMTEQARQRMLVKAVHDATIEIATRQSFEPCPPPKSGLQMFAISELDIFELVRLRIPNVTLDEVENAITESLPYLGDV
jgi:hypothetical protein